MTLGLILPCAWSSAAAQRSSRVRMQTCLPLRLLLSVLASVCAVLTPTSTGRASSRRVEVARAKAYTLHHAAAVGDVESINLLLTAGVLTKTR